MVSEKNRTKPIFQYRFNWKTENSDCYQNDLKKISTNFSSNVSQLNQLQFLRGDNWWCKIFQQWKNKKRRVKNWHIKKPAVKNGAGTFNNQNFVRLDSFTKILRSAFFLGAQIFQISESVKIGELFLCLIWLKLTLVENRCQLLQNLIRALREWNKSVVPTQNVEKLWTGNEAEGKVTEVKIKSTRADT